MTTEDPPDQPGADEPRGGKPRLSFRAGVAVITALFVGAVAITYLSSWIVEPRSEPPTEKAASVVVFGIPRLGLGDLGAGTMPTLDRLAEEGAAASMTVRTLRAGASTPEAYATLSAGTRVRGSAAAGDAMPPTAEIEGSTAREVAERRTGLTADGEVVVVGAAETISLAGKSISSLPGALADNLGDAGLLTAVVGNADTRTRDGTPVVRRPAAVAAMNSAGSVDLGVVDESLLEVAPEAPYGVAANPDAYAAQVRRVMGEASFVVVDPGETDRADSYRSAVGEARADEMRREALRRTDVVLAEVVEALPDDALLLVLGTRRRASPAWATPPTRCWRRVLSSPRW